MKAIVCTKYGSPDFLELQEVAKPIPKDDEVLIKIYATTISAGDSRVRGARFPAGFWLLARLALGFGSPKKSILGTDLSGEIEAIGKNVTSLKVGDQVFALSGARFGAHAEYVCLPDNSPVALKPTNMSYEEAATIPFGAGTALVFLRDHGHIQSGQRVLVYGASGAVGSAWVQIAKYYGTHVTAVCSTGNVELVRSLGADVVIDYTKEDFVKSSEQYDIILETVGKVSFSHAKTALKEKGLYLMVVGGIPEYLQMLWSTMTGTKKAIAGIALPSKQDLMLLKEMAEAGKLKAVIDTEYPLEQAADAHRYVDAWHKKWNVVIKVV
jgi:NADPH:quinone reductase-like Zn-dependent oxidoreductase